MNVPELWKAGDNKTVKINEIILFLQNKFSEGELETDEDAVDESVNKVSEVEPTPPTWSQAATPERLNKWRFRTPSLLLNRQNESRMLNKLTEEEKAEVIADLGSLEFPNESVTNEQNISQ